jgi:dTDP-4-dehydrorhamnose 3,5-epimerase-like enzyme
MSDMHLPEIIVGGVHQDVRGTLAHVNDFDMSRVKRFYTIEHPATTIVRAWQGHKEEEKWFYVIRGIFQVKLIRIDNWEAPSEKLKASEFILTADESKVLHIPAGYANGFRALEPDSKLIVFSNFTVEQSAKDNFRYAIELWGKW